MIKLNKHFVIVFFSVMLLISVLGGAIGGAIGGFLGFFETPIAHIQLPGEIIPGIGISNTTLTLWLGILIIFSIIFFSTRNLKEVPNGRLQNLVEALVEFFIKLAVSIAGGKKGRRFVPLVLSIFLCVLISNWVGVLPGVGTIGIIEPAETVYKHTEHKFIDDPSCNHTDVHTDSDSHSFSCEPALKEHLVVFNRVPGLGLHYLPPGRGGENVEDGGGVVEVREVIEHESKVDHGPLKGQLTGRLLPIFRGANTDLNTTLAIAIVSMVAVQFWGIRSLGLRTYGSKFLNFSSPVMFFVGILETIAEVSRIISFTFRLFGNMFGGEVLLVAMMYLLPFIGIIPFMGLELFVGVIQALIFSMLTLFFGVAATASHNEH